MKNNNSILKGLKGNKNGNWKGGVHNRSDGYVLIRIGVIPRKNKGTRYRLQHRIVMEQHLGRTLLRSEIIHHINGIKNDNRIENLKVMTQAEHAKQDYELRKKNEKGQLL